MAYIGNTVQNQGFTPAIDYFSGNGVTVTFTLSRPVVSVAQMIVAVDNVIQNPSSAYTVSGSSITFTSAPLSGTNNIWVEYTSLITTYNAISQDPSVIGDLTASGGFLSTGDFGNSYIDGTIVDYVTGNARITTGPIDDMTFYHGGTASRSEMMKLSYAGNSYVVGNFGVGDTSPAGSANYAQLSIKGTSGAELSLKAGATQYGYIYGDSGGLRIINPQSGSASGTMQFFTSNTERMRIAANGTVMIGTNTATAGMLAVYANNAISIDGPTNGPYIEIRKTGTVIGYIGSGAAINSGNIGIYSTTGAVNVQSGGSGGVNLNSGATSWSSASDARLKNVIGTYSNALTAIAQLEPVKFTWKDDADKKPQVGILAQSIQNVVPEAIDTFNQKDDETDYLAVRYTELIPLLTAAIQELKAEVDALKAQLEAK